jgi:hypothetical protein
MFIEPKEVSMRRSYVNRLVVLVALAVLIAAAPGCALFNRVNQPQITVQFGSGQMLHIAVLPRALPDGTSAEAQRNKLLEEIAGLAGGYTLIDNVLGGWIPPGQKDVVQERNDLLLVKGPPQAAYLLRARLMQDFKQEVPFVESLPIQAIAVLHPGMEEPAGPATSEQKAATDEVAAAK